MTINKLLQIALFHKFPVDQQQWLLSMSETYAFSFQQLQMLAEYSADLINWNAGPLEQFHHPEAMGKARGKPVWASGLRGSRQGHRR